MGLQPGLDVGDSLGGFSEVDGLDARLAGSGDVRLDVGEEDGLSRPRVGEGGRLQQALLRHHRHRLRAGVDAQLVEGGGQVVVDGAGGEEELLPDGLVGEPMGH
jgi:hypothetical protein